ncbi:hypothetical protein HR12_26030, partial [Microbacterium sp. SUBG005]
MHTMTDRSEVFHGELVLSGVGRAVLDDLLSAGGSTTTGAETPEGAQVKVNMILSRLPRLRDGAVSPEAAFS